MKKIIANLKMNQTVSQTKEYLMTLVPRFNKKHDLILCLPYTSLCLGKFLTENSGIKIGAQNMSDEEKGPFTGEISGEMIKDTGADYVLIGHSEDRIKFRETNKMVNKKVKLALKNGLQVILCIGESKTEKVADKTKNVLQSQIEEGLKGLYENELENITIAYEPLWTIGGDTPLTNKEIEAAVKYIRDKVCELFSEKAGEEISIVYGGGLNNKNISVINKCNAIDGFMLSSLSLNVNNFLQTLADLSD